MRAVRLIQTCSIATLLIACSLMLIASANATERQSVRERAEAYREAREYPHIHAKPQRHEHPPLHSEGTRRDSSADDTFYDSTDDFDYRRRIELDRYSDEPEDE